MPISVVTQHLGTTNFQSILRSTSRYKGLTVFSLINARQFAIGEFYLRETFSSELLCKTVNTLTKKDQNILGIKYTTRFCQQRLLEAVCPVVGTVKRFLSL